MWEGLLTILSSRGYHVRRSDEKLHDLLTLNVPLVPATNLVQYAFLLALQHQRTVYDPLYLALAQERNGDLIRADSAPTVWA
jgi:predicted nucleic acid-binding protein